MPLAHLSATTVLTAMPMLPSVNLVSMAIGKDCIPLSTCSRLLVVVLDVQAVDWPSSVIASKARHAKTTTFAWGASGRKSHKGMQGTAGWCTPSLSNLRRDRQTSTSPLTQNAVWLLPTRMVLYRRWSQEVMFLHTTHTMPGYSSLQSVCSWQPMSIMHRQVHTQGRLEPF